MSRLATDPIEAFRSLATTSGRQDRLVHLESLPAREARYSAWPTWAPPAVVDGFQARGIEWPWTHQVEAAELAFGGRNVVVSTGTASGKSMAYLLPGLSAIADGTSVKGRRPRDRGPTVCYVAPTKALAHDQLDALEKTGAGLPQLRAAPVDGDTSREARDWARDHATWVLTNPDMLHRSLLPAHHRWARFLAGLTLVVVDECHHYRGVFGSHVAHVLRRLRRLAAHYGAEPTFVLASATIAAPEVCGRRLTGLPVQAVTDDGSPRGEGMLALWEPPLTDAGGERGAPVRRTATAETADLLTDLVAGGIRTLAFCRSRRAAESVAMTARRNLAEIDPALTNTVATYRGGYLPEDRRALEADLREGRLLGTAATNALELGVDVVGLDAVLVAGFPGTRAALWQQLGRAGRRGRRSVGLLVARDDPLDTYLVRHPETLLGRPVESTVLDPDNPYVLGPHLCAAAQELPLGSADLELFGPTAVDGVAALVADGLLRRRPTGWFWTRRERASDLADIRSSGGAPVQVVDLADGRLLGTVDAAAAHSSVHAGAVHLHRGQPYLVRTFDVDHGVALVEIADPDYSTTAREITDIEIVSVQRTRTSGAAQLALGTVQVTSQVVGFLRRLLVTGEVLGEEPLDLPSRSLTTVAVWWTLEAELLADGGLAAGDIPGAAHAAEHAAIGLLPLFATCDRWDIGGMSTALHPDTGRLTVFVHDGHPGGAGFAERGYDVAERWLTTTRDAITACACAAGCPSCVQSPKCGNANSPLDKPGAVRLLELLLGELAMSRTGSEVLPTG
ncbi:MAG: DEAD/DEAH box helicase [Nocardioidaceae bacterium]|nr:DEAD/DEAH box helicase [Nocardioidaceae bacterium]